MTISRRSGLLSAVAACAIVVLLLVAAPAGAASIGMLGDSMSAGNGSSFGEFPNWSSQLVTAGKFTLPSGANAAVGGARVADLTTQFNTSTFQAVLPSLNYVVVIMGGNDAVALGAGAMSPTDYLHDVVTDIANVLAAIHTSAPAAHRIVATVPDVFVSPLVQQNVVTLGLTPSQISAYEAVIQTANSQIISYADSHGIPVLDLYAGTATVVPPLPSAQSPFISNTPLVLDGYSFTKTTGLFASDQFHPGVIVHGLLANMVISAADRGYGATLTAMSDQTLVQTAGKTPVGGATTFDVKPYVLVPEPSSGMLAALALVTVSRAAIRRRDLRRG